MVWSWSRCRKFQKWAAPATLPLRIKASTDLAQARHRPQRPDQRGPGLAATAPAVCHGARCTHQGRSTEENSVKKEVFRYEDSGRRGSIFIDSASGQKSESGSRRPLNPDPSCFFLLSEESIERCNVLKLNKKFSIETKRYEK